jgi:glutamate dehydrogenase
MAADPRASASLADAFSQALLDGALPGETEGFTPAEQAEAGAFIAEAAAVRRPGEIALKLQSVGGEAARRLMRLVIVNDDMPFLVDSVAAVIAGHGLTVHRLLHPIVRATRDGDRLASLGDGAAESIIYVELDRADARGRQDLVQEVENVLACVRAAVGDWKAMVALMHQDAAALAGDLESAALLEWLAADNFTLLGHKSVAADGTCGEGLGILSAEGIDLWSQEDLRGLFDTLREDPRPVLALKADRLSPVHRRVPLDVVVVRKADDTLSIHAGLWTSAALRSPPAEIPMVRRRLAEIDRELGFAPASHGAKALAHAMSTLSPDLLVSFGTSEVRSAVLTAMSLADRPRPAMLLLPGALHRHLFAFVWLPRDELTTTRRIAITRMIEEAVLSSVTSWAVELGDGDLALIRLTLGFSASRPLPDVAQLDRQLVDMVRGWAPAVEAELSERVGSGRATRLALTYLPGVPEDYRSRAGAGEAASDILRLCALEGAEDRDVRLFREASDRPGQLRLKLYRSGGLVPLSEAVPVLENFGFRVIEERPTALGEDSRLGHIHDFRLESAGADADQMLARTDVIEGAIAAVLQRHAEDDEFNQLVLFAGLDPQPVVWLRAWFRYLRQTGVAYGLITMVDALKRTPAATRALIGWFSAAHDPARDQRKTAVEAEKAAFETALNGVKSIDDDRILRLFRAVVEATLRTNAFAPKADEALAFKLDPTRVPGLPAPIPYREIWVYSPRVEGIHLRGGPVARGGLRWSDRRDDFRTESSADEGAAGERTP